MTRAVELTSRPACLPPCQPLLILVSRVANLNLDPARVSSVYLTGRKGRKRKVKSIFQFPVARPALCVIGEIIKRLQFSFPILRRALVTGQDTGLSLQYDLRVGSRGCGLRRRQRQRGQRYRKVLCHAARGIKLELGGALLNTAGIEPAGCT